MRKSTLGIIIAAIALLALVGVVVANRSDNTATSPPTTQNQPQSNQMEAEDEPTRAQENATSTQQAPTSSNVEISNFAFVPSSITVKKGTTVKWTNKDSERHDVTPDNENADFQGSELLGRNESYEWTFKDAGTYSYFCSPHPHMKGTVIVTE